MVKVSIDGMAAEIMKEMQKYGETVADELKTAARKVGKETAKELQGTSPKNSGKYAKGWTSTVNNENANSIDIVVHDKKYQITHLLEKGHQNRNGGRTPAIVHIAPAEKEAADRLERELIKRL